MDSYKARQVLGMSVITPESSRDLLNKALDALSDYEFRFMKIKRLKQEKERARDDEKNCDESKEIFLIRETEINLLNLILKEE